MLHDCRYASIATSVMQTIKFKKVDLSEHDLMDQIYRLRFQVYGRECGFISEGDYPDGLEKDEYDSQSVHFAAINSFGEVVGAMRIILPGTHPYPVEKNCPEVQLDQETIPGVMRFAEISRLVISKQLRRRFPLYMAYGHKRKRDAEQADNAYGSLKDAKPIVWGLCREAYKESKCLGITHFYALMEKGLWALLRMYGFKFRCVGKQIDCFGPVHPYISEIGDIEKVYN